MLVGAKSGTLAMLLRHWLPFAARVVPGEVRREDLLALKALIEAGKVRPVIDRQYPLSEAREAVRYVGSGEARAKAVINAAGVPDLRL